MEGVVSVAERLTWEQIKAKYSGQWVRLEEVVRDSSNETSIISAVVASSGEPTTQDLLDAMDGKCMSRFIDDGRYLNVGTVAVV